METGEKDGIEIRKRDRRKRTKRLPLLCVICPIIMTLSACEDSLQKEESWGKADVAQASLLIIMKIIIMIISKAISLMEQTKKEMLFTSCRNKTQERPLTRGKGPENHTLPDTKAQDRLPNR